MDDLTELVLSVAGSAWMYPLVFVLTVADAFLVIVPSETVVVALAALSMSTGAPNLGMLIPVAAVGAMIGDAACYLLGRRIGLTRFRWMRGEKVAAAIGWAQRALDRRAAVLILTARYIPFARIAVNLTAGAMRFPVRRYAPLTAIAGCGWAVYNTVIGAAFGVWLKENPLLAVLVSVVVAIVLGMIIDVVSAKIADRRRARTETASE